MSLRALTVRQVNRLLLPKREMLGISRLANLGPFVGLNACVVQAVRVALVKGQVSATTGKGWNVQQALCGALGEAFERYCAAHPPEFTRRRRTSADVEPLAGWGHPDGFAPADLYPALELQVDRPCLLPAVDVHFPYHGTDLDSTPVRPHTSGLASGASVEEATLFGLFEVIERHASSRFFARFQRERTGVLIDPDAIRNARIESGLRDLKHHGYESLIFRIDAMLPVYYVAVLDASNLGPKFMVAGVAAHIDDHAALEAALLEAIQAIVIAAQGAREDLARVSASYRKQQTGQTNPFYRIRRLLAELNETRRMSEPSRQPDPRTNDALAHVLRRLRDAGMNRVYRCDLSKQALPLKVAKIIVPGMFDTHVNPTKLNHAATTT
ncbi:YcaO-like family protein [Caballeronia sp. LZ032]|uniref:YcaO-like family protein n=1 Tax=Caballeronia sp. LZ032 TaxID=3038565 RepID=UPI0028603354|nr:YcaO-like family protein [Caballeronia sp. LZ032]MDR5880855.1 YcaO-like family protein [Caballeronia sp. LZ032]